MKFLLPLAVCLCLLSVSFGQAPGFGSPFEPPVEQPRPEVLGSPVSITVDMISVPRAEAFNLVRLNSAAMWQSVSEMVRDGTAKSEFLACVTTGSDERAILECIKEIRSATNITFELEMPRPIIQDPKTTGEKFMWLTNLSAFDARNAGTALEVLPFVHGDFIHLELIPYKSRLDRFIAYPKGAEKSPLHIDQPYFQSAKIQTRVVVQSGKPLFLGLSYKYPDADGMVSGEALLLFLTASIVGKDR